MMRPLTASSRAAGLKLLSSRDQLARSPERPVSKLRTQATVLDARGRAAESIHADGDHYVRLARPLLPL